MKPKLILLPQPEEKYERWPVVDEQGRETMWDALIKAELLKPTPLGKMCVNCGGYVAAQNLHDHVASGSCSGGGSRTVPAPLPDRISPWVQIAIGILLGFALFMTVSSLLFAWGLFTSH